MTKFDIRTVNLRALNSLTKYPSIPTYHELDPRNGSLLDNFPPVRFEGQVIGTEKVDGTNARIILTPDGNYLLGSREELLYAKGDLIGNPNQGIVASLKAEAERLTPLAASVALVGFYLELFGGKIGGQAKQYSATGSVGWRLFDVAYINQLDERLSWPAERISSWRDSGGQTFAGERDLVNESATTGFELTPRLFTLDAGELPTEIEKMRAFLGEQLPGTLVALDDSAKGAGEGIVLRTADRSVIAKARFQDYERTLKRRASDR